MSYQLTNTFEICILRLKNLLSALVLGQSQVWADQSDTKMCCSVDQSSKALWQCSDTKEKGPVAGTHRWGSLRQLELDSLDVIRVVLFERESLLRKPKIAKPCSARDHAQTTNLSFFRAPSDTSSITSIPSTIAQVNPRVLVESVECEV